MPASTDARAIVNPHTGQRMRFLRTGADTDGALLEIETTNPPGGPPEPQHVHPRQVSHCRVVSGSLRFDVEGVERTLLAGDEIEIPAGAAHRFWNDGDVDAVAIQAVRPALATQAFFEEWFALAAAGQIGPRGVPSMLRLAILVPAYGDVIRLATPPWPLQRLVFGLLRPLARLRGVRPVLPS